MVIKALLVGFLYWIGICRMNFFVSSALRWPVVLGVLIGLVFGDVKMGLLYGATIQLMYIGGIAAGGNIPNDYALAACIAIPAAMMNNLDASAAVALAVPFGVLGVLSNNLRRTFNTFFNAIADKAVEDRNYGKLEKVSFALPLACNFVLYFIPVFIATLVGPTLVEGVLSIVPGWFVTGLSNAGNVLPALGFALTLVVMGKRNYLPYFALGFFTYAVLGYSMLTGAIFGLCMALLSLQFKQNEDGGVL